MDLNGWKLKMDLNVRIIVLKRKQNIYNNTLKLEPEFLYKFDTKWPNTIWIQEVYFWKITSRKPQTCLNLHGFLISTANWKLHIQMFWQLAYPNVLPTYVSPFPCKLTGVFQLWSQWDRFFNLLEPNDQLLKIAQKYQGKSSMDKVPII
jgi:hypothetical protein